MDDKFLADPNQRTMTEREKIFKNSITGLLYPAFLGYFITEIAVGADSFTSVSALLEQIRTDTLTAISRLLLLLGVLLFYCCDYANTCRSASRYRSFGIDLLKLALIAFMFKGANVGSFHREPGIGIILWTTILFMLAYLYRYYIKMDDVEKQEYKKSSRLRVNHAGCQRDPISTVLPRYR